MSTIIVVVNHRHMRINPDNKDYSIINITKKVTINNIVYPVNNDLALELIYSTANDENPLSFDVLSFAYKNDIIEMIAMAQWCEINNIVSTTAYNYKVALLNSIYIYADSIDSILNIRTSNYRSDYYKKIFHGTTKNPQVPTSTIKLKTLNMIKYTPLLFKIKDFDDNCAFIINNLFNNIEIDSAFTRPILLTEIFKHGICALMNYII